MNLGDFNEESEKPEFMYKKNQLVPHSYQIFQYKQDKANYEPVGTYNLLDMEESEDLTEKRVMNLIAVMNQRKRTIDLSSLTNARTLYTMVPMKPEDNDQKIIFRTYDGAGVSKENAILVIEKGVFHE